MQGTCNNSNKICHRENDELELMHLFVNRSRAMLPHTKFAPARERLTRLIVLLPHTNEGAKWLTFILDCTLGCINCTAPTLRWSVYFYSNFLSTNFVLLAALRHLYIFIQLY